MREALAEAISRLPEREKLVVTLYYYEELTLREIGEVLGVTESRVSQLHTKAILRLRSRLHGVDASRPELGGFRIGRDPCTTVREERGMSQEPGKIRNVAVVGHRGTGKTSLVEAMLFQAGAINRLGTVEAGTTSPTGTRTSSAGRCPSPPRSPTWSGRAARST